MSTFVPDNTKLDCIRKHEKVKSARVELFTLGGNVLRVLAFFFFCVISPASLSPNECTGAVGELVAYVRKGTSTVFLWGGEILFHLPLQAWPGCVVTNWGLVGDVKLVVLSSSSYYNSLG